MGLEDIIDVTNDIGAADVILACSSELEKNPWIRGVAKLHQLPVFVIKVLSLTAPPAVSISKISFLCIDLLV